MPTSERVFDTRVRDFLATHRFKSYLDIGPGAGKYGKMIKELMPEAKVFCIEAEDNYIKQFDLKSTYDVVHHSKVEAFFDDKPDFTIDVVIIGDCLEHLKKSDGLDLINYLVYRCRYILIVFPSKYVQYSINGFSSEAHLSVWSKHDFANFNFKYIVKKRYIRGRFIRPLYMNLVIIRGYIGNPSAISDWIEPGIAKRIFQSFIKKCEANPNLHWLQTLIQSLRTKIPV